MKAQEEIEARIRGLLIAELDRRVESAHRRLPARCIHHHYQELDPRPKVVDETNPGYNRVDRRYLPVVNAIGLCMLGAEEVAKWQGTICEDTIDAQRCPDFTPFESKDAILSNLARDLEDHAWVRDNMPELYGLVWVLDGAWETTLPWWKRLWFRLLRVRLEPIAPSFDITRALPAPESKGDSSDGV